MPAPTGYMLIVNGDRVGELDLRCWLRNPKSQSLYEIGLLACLIASSSWAGAHMGLGSSAAAPRLGKRLRWGKHLQDVAACLGPEILHKIGAGNTRA